MGTAAADGRKMVPGTFDLIVIGNLCLLLDALPDHPICYHARLVPLE